VSVSGAAAGAVTAARATAETESPKSASSKMYEDGELSTSPGTVPWGLSKLKS